MGLHIGIGFSREPSASQAAREAALQAKTQTKQKTVHTVLVFSTSHYRPLETLRMVRQICPEANILGCSTAGILLDESIEMQGVGVLAIQSDEIQFGANAVQNIDDQDAQLAGSELARKTMMDFGPGRRSLFLLLADSSLQNNERLVRGVQNIFGKAFPLVGATCSDFFQFDKTSQFLNETPMEHSAVALLVGGQINIGIGSRHGWKPLGKPRLVNEAEGENIRIIDRKRASSIYEEYFGIDLDQMQQPDFTSTAMLYPLGFALSSDQEFILRKVVNVKSDGTLITQGEIPKGAEVHITISNKDFVQQATLDAVGDVKDALCNKKPRLILVFDSLARRKILGRSCFSEIQTIKNIFGPGVPIFGMYSYGEVSPLESADHIGQACLHQQTITILGIA